MDMGARMISIRDHASKAEEERRLREELVAATTGAPTDRDRQLAIAGVLEKYGQVERGLNIRNAADQRDALAEDRAHQRTLRPLQVNAAQRSDRAGAQAEADDATLRATDTEVAGFLDQRITNPDGTKRSVTPDDHVQATLYRAGALQRAGKTEKAAEAMKNYQAAAMGKIAMENTERAEAARVAMAGVRAGKFDAFTQFFDTYIPDGSKVVSIKPLAGGKVEITREAQGKRLKPDVTTVNEMLVGIEAAVDPRSAWQMTIQLADRAMRERSEARADRADGRAAATHAAGAPERAVAGQVARLQAKVLDTTAPAADREAAAALLQEHRAVTSRQPGLTAAQLRGNAEIDAAREAIAGLDPHEIRRRTTKTSDTGRDNPDFDPTIARAAQLAARRKVGDDGAFDDRQAGPQRPPAPTMPDRADVAKRFRSDRAMNPYKLGKDTQHGVEVLDGRGQVVGYYK